MKKIIYIGLILAMCLFITACSTRNENAPVESEPPAVASQVTLAPLARSPSPVPISIQEAEQPEPQPIPVQNPRPATANFLNYAEFLRLLDVNGFIYEVNDASSIFLSVGAKQIIIADMALFALLVYEYESTEAMENDSKLIDRGGNSINQSEAGVDAHVSWASTPHWFKRDLLIVLYVGEDENMLNFLNGIFGDVFAGGRRVASEPNERAASEPNERVASEPNERVASEPNERVASEPNERVASEPNERVASEPNERAASEPNERAASEPNAVINPMRGWLVNLIRGWLLYLSL